MVVKFVYIRLLHGRGATSDMLYITQNTNIFFLTGVIFVLIGTILFY